jgi:DNA-binding transcriptional regulator YhcF (GntR family)
VGAQTRTHPSKPRARTWQERRRLMFTIDPRSDRPAFEQLRTHIADQVREGVLPAGSALPTVRRMAADLGLAPNTVAKAYRVLEQDGFVVTAGRRGTTVADQHVDVTDDARRRTVTHVAALRELGITPSEITRLLREVLDDSASQ